MSFGDIVKTALLENLATKQNIIDVVDSLKAEILRCVALEKIPTHATIYYELDWCDCNTNMLKMLIKEKIGVYCDINEGRIWCSLINFI